MTTVNLVSSESKGITIGRPMREEADEILTLCAEVIRDTFQINGVGHMTEFIEDEIASKRKYLFEDFESDGALHHFLVARAGGRIVATIAYGPANPDILSCDEDAFKGLMEVGTAFVLKEAQGQGLGSQMMRAIMDQLRAHGHKAFCFDSGYTSAQRIWTYKFGEPNFVLKDYWGEGADHMVWRVSL